MDLTDADASIVWTFGNDGVFSATIRDSSMTYCEATGTYETIADKLYITPTEAIGSECDLDMFSSDVAEYSIVDNILTMTQIGDNPVWYKCVRLQ